MKRLHLDRIKDGRWQQDLALPGLCCAHRSQGTVSQTIFTFRQGLGARKSLQMSFVPLGYLGRKALQWGGDAEHGFSASGPSVCTCRAGFGAGIALGCRAPTAQGLRSRAGLLGLPNSKTCC